MTIDLTDPNQVASAVQRFRQIAAMTDEEYKAAAPHEELRALAPVIVFALDSLAAVLTHTQAADVPPPLLEAQAFLMRTSALLLPAMRAGQICMLDLTEALRGPDGTITAAPFRFGTLEDLRTTEIGASLLEAMPQLANDPCAEHPPVGKGEACWVIVRGAGGAGMLIRMRSSQIPATSAPGGQG